METSSPRVTPARSPAVAAAPGGTVVRLLRFAVANIGRRPERFILSVLGIALAIACVVVVRTIAASFAGVGAASVSDVLEEAQLWAVPAAGVHYDQNVQSLVADGPAPSLSVPAGWRAVHTLSGVAEIDGVLVSLRGSDEIDSPQAVLSPAAALRLGLQDGDTVMVGDRDLAVVISAGSSDAGQSVTVPVDVAAPVIGDHGWWTVYAPPGQETRRDLARELAAANSLPSTPDPAVSPDPTGSGLIYDTVGGSGPLTFEQKFSALFSGTVTGSTLGFISMVGLGLGFVIAVSSFLAAVAERKREFGIMSSIGLADEVLYFFLVESAVIFVVSYLIGVLGAGLAVALVLPQLATLTAWAQASAMVAAFLPAMAIVDALIPVHRLLQQRPVALLEER